MLAGTLIVRPISAKLTHDTEFFGTMDPYVVVLFANQSQRTRVCRNGGKHPYWDEELIFQLSGANEDFLRIRVMDRETLSSDDHIGEGLFALSRLSGGRFEEHIRLEYRGRQAGELKLRVQMVQTGAGVYRPSGYPQPGYVQPGLTGYPPPQYGGYPQPQYQGNYPPPQYQSGPTGAYPSASYPPGSYPQSGYPSGSYQYR